MRAIWKGAISFGLVSIGVRLFSATEEKDIRFHQVHRTDGGRIRYKRVCSVDGEEVSYDDIAKGYDLGGGELVVLTDEDFAELPLTTSRAIEVLEFVPAEQVDPILYSKAYYLEPEATAAKPYVLLRDALTSTDRVAVVKITMRQREQLATLRVRDGVMLLNTMLWPDEVRAPEFGFLDEEFEVRPGELAMAGSLIESMAADFDPDAYTDDYRAALQEMIDAKTAGREIVAPEEPAAASGGAIDLMAALRASVERARAARGADDGGGGGRSDGAPAEPTPIGAAKSAKRAASPAARESTARESTARAQTARKPGQRESGGRKAAGPAGGRSAEHADSGADRRSAATRRESSQDPAKADTTKRGAARRTAATGVTAARKTPAAGPATPAKPTPAKTATGKTATGKTATGKTATGKTATGKTAAKRAGAA